MKRVVFIIVLGFISWNCVAQFGETEENRQQRINAAREDGEQRQKDMKGFGFSNTPNYKINSDGTFSIIYDDVVGNRDVEVTGKKPNINIQLPTGSSSVGESILIRRDSDGINDNIIQGRNDLYENNFPTVPVKPTQQHHQLEEDIKTFLQEEVTNIEAQGEAKPFGDDSPSNDIEPSIILPQQPSINPDNQNYINQQPTNAVPSNIFPSQQPENYDNQNNTKQQQINAGIEFLHQRYKSDFQYNTPRNHAMMAAIEAVNWNDKGAILKIDAILKAKDKGWGLTSAEFAMLNNIFFGNIPQTGYSMGGGYTVGGSVGGGYGGGGSTAKGYHSGGTSNNWSNNRSDRGNFRPAHSLTDEEKKALGIVIIATAVVIGTFFLVREITSPKHVFALDNEYLPIHLNNENVSTLSERFGYTKVNIIDLKEKTKSGNYLKGNENITKK